MYKQYPSIYHHTQVPLLCCPSSYKNATLIKQKGTDLPLKGKSNIKKISLKKNNQSKCKQITNQSTYYSYNCKTQRTQTNYPESQITQPNYQHSLTQKPTMASEQGKKNEAITPQVTNLVYHMRNRSAVVPTTKTLTQKNKIQRIMPANIEPLRNSKNSTSSQALLFLQKMKESVASFTESDGYSAKLEESQILLDYFHPTQGQLMKIKTIFNQEGRSVSSLS